MVQDKAILTMAEQ